ncbi:hypothetical protein LEMLEM_LOCUS15332 [Lemmus lemmus]
MDLYLDSILIHTASINPGSQGAPTLLHPFN